MGMFVHAHDENGDRIYPEGESPGEQEEQDYTPLVFKEVRHCAHDTNTRAQPKKKREAK